MKAFEIHREINTFRNGHTNEEKEERGFTIQSLFDKKYLWNRDWTIKLPNIVLTLCIENIECGALGLYCQYSKEGEIFLIRTVIAIYCTVIYNIIQTTEVQQNNFSAKNQDCLHVIGTIKFE